MSERFRTRLIVNGGKWLGLLAATVALVITTAGCGSEKSEPESPRGKKGKASALLFSQTARSGSLVAKSRASGVYTLTLKPVDPNVVYFTDRPGRRAGTMPDQEFVGLFRAQLLPNAALVAEVPAGGESVSVFELSNPKYDAKGRVATYDARFLEEASGGLAEYDGQLSDRLPTTFGEAGLFIDGMPAGCPVKVANGIGETLTLRSIDPAEDAEGFARERSYKIWTKLPPNTISQGGTATYDTTHSDECYNTVEWRVGDAGLDATVKVTYKGYGAAWAPDRECKVEGNNPRGVQCRILDFNLPQGFLIEGG